MATAPVTAEGQAARALERPEADRRNRRSDRGRGRARPPAHPEDTDDALEVVAPRGRLDIVA